MTRRFCLTLDLKDDPASSRNTTNTTREMDRLICPFCIDPPCFVRLRNDAAGLRLSIIVRRRRASDGDTDPRAAYKGALTRLGIC